LSVAEEDGNAFSERLYAASAGASGTRIRSNTTPNTIIQIGNK
jgi:hypothetical protein